MDPGAPHHLMPTRLRWALCGCGAGAAILAVVVVHGGSLPLPWTALLGVVAALAAMLLVP